jgi:integrase
MIISLFVSPSAFTFLIMPPNVSQEFLPPEGPHVLGVLTHRSASSILIFHRENLSLDQGRAILREKGSKTRVVPFTRYTAQLLRDWLEVRPSEAQTVFCALWHDHYAKPLSVSGSNQIIRRLKNKAAHISQESEDVDYSSSSE